MTTTLQELDEVLAKIAERTDGDYLARLASGTNTAVICVHFIRDHAPEIRAALELQAKLEQGFVLVPREPDAEMLDAAIDAHLGFSGEDEVDEVWKAMLTAAPNMNELFGNSGQLGWQPIETAPKDGSAVLVSNAHGCWIAKYLPVYQSGYRPRCPWQSLMINHEYMRDSGGVLYHLDPTQWMPLPAPPAGGEEG